MTGPRNTAVTVDDGASVSQESALPSRGVYPRLHEPFAQVVVPDHKELDRGTLRAILRQADLSIEDFVAQHR